VQERLEELRQLQEPTAEQNPWADLSAQNLLKLGEKLEQEGEVARAEQVYRQILKMDATLDVHAKARKVASESMLPQEASGCWIPNPMRLSTDSAAM